MTDEEIPGRRGPAGDDNSFGIEDVYQPSQGRPQMGADQAEYFQRGGVAGGRRIEDTERRQCCAFGEH